MKAQKHDYPRHRFSSEIISPAIWLYHHFCLGFREVEELLAGRGVTLPYETLRYWCRKIGSDHARQLKKRQRRIGDTGHIDEFLVTIQGQRHELWRVVDQDADVFDLVVQRPRNHREAERFFRHLIYGQGGEPRRLMTDKLQSDNADRELSPSRLCQQSCKSVERTHKPMRTPYARIFFTHAGRTISDAAGTHAASLSSRSALRPGGQLSAFAYSVGSGLAGGSLHVSGHAIVCPRVSLWVHGTLN